MKITDGPTPHPAASRSLVAYEQAVARLRAAHHEFVDTPVVSEQVLMARNVAVVQALEAGVPETVVRRITRMGDVAFQLAVARGTYHRHLIQGCPGAAASATLTEH